MTTHLRWLLVVMSAALAAACSGGTGIRPVTWTSLAAGETHTCGLTTTNRAYCWGDNEYGQLGDGTLTARFRPVAVSGNLTFATLAAGHERTCGATSGGATYCWGAGAQVQRPVAGFHSPMPIAVPIDIAFTALSFGFERCGLTGTGAVWCWRFGTYGLEEPTQVVGLGGEVTFTALAGGGFHTCVLTGLGAAYCWGWNRNGELGSGAPDTLAHSTPVAVRGGLAFTTLAAGDSHTCGVTSAGAAYCWGSNEFGQLGNGTTSYPGIASPVPVLGGLRFTTLAAGPAHTCGLTRDGAAYCWGDNWSGELGAGLSRDTSTTPVLVAGGLRFIGITAGGSHTCGVVSGGAAYCWGANGGQLGDGTTTDRRAPVRVLGP